MNIIVPVENRHREFRSKIWLASALSTAGHRVTVGEDSIIWQNMDKLNPDLYFTLTARPRSKQIDRLKEMQETSIRTACLDTEGGAFDGGEAFLSKRVSPDALEHIDLYCAWGAQSSKIVQKVVYENDLSTNVEITGNPRFDLLHPDMSILYEEDAKQITKTYGDYLLINMNYGLGNSEISPDQTFILLSIMSLAHELSQSDIDKNIVIRPHPSGNNNIYQTIFESYDSVYVKKQGEVRPWISAADAVIHNSCTTGLESALMNTLTISYLPDSFDDHLSNQVSHKANNAAEIIEYIESHSSNDMDTSLIKNYIENTDVKSADIISSIISSDYINSGETVGVIRQNRSLTQYLGDYIYKLSPSLYRNIRNSKLTPGRWTYVDYKFDIVSDDYVDDLTSKFSRVLEKEIKYTKYDNTDNLYEFIPIDDSIE